MVGDKLEDHGFGPSLTLDHFEVHLPTVVDRRCHLQVGDHEAFLGFSINGDEERIIVVPVSIPVRTTFHW